MSKFVKYSLAWCLVVVLLIPLLAIQVNAAEVSYESRAGYLYNWGIRGEVATFLSPNASAFYEENRTSYDILASYSGGTSQTNAPSSELYNTLKALMTNAHTYINNYSASRDLFQYTDCQNGGGAISSFYSGNSIGPSWDGSWNREHTWPNSKGLGGSDEDDLMMLRPTSVSENSSRGNTAYGKSSGYYNPNAESNGEYDLRGDVARICLYVYVRWGNTSYMWGKSGVIESVDVLLEWMEADPVDTWELGRNDSVESITGTRNVFVDYPELAFLLFGEEIPETMTTPSGGDAQDCGHNNFDAGVVIAATCIHKGYTVYSCKTAGCDYSYTDHVTVPTGHSYQAVTTAPTCTKMGYTTYTCTVCSSSYVSDQVAMIPHSYQNDTCTVCGATKSSSAEITLSFADAGYRTLLTKTQQVWSKDGVVLTNDKASATSDIANYVNPVRFYSGTSITIEASDSITRIVFDCNSASYANVLQKSIGSAAVVSSDKVTVSLDGSSNSFKVAKLTAQVRVDSITVTCASAEQTCAHTNTVDDKAVAPTCTATGLTAGKHCADCGEVLLAPQTVAALGHTEVTDAAVAPTCTKTGLTEGKHCSVCGSTLVAQKEVAALGHAYRSIVTAPTCTEPGYTTYTCSCGDTYEDDEIAAAGHTPSDWIVDTQAQIGVAGSRHKECTTCGESLETEVIEPLTEAPTTQDPETQEPATQDPSTESTETEDATTDPSATESEKDSQNESETDASAKPSGGCNGTVCAFVTALTLAASCVALCKKRRG